MDGTATPFSEDGLVEHPVLFMNEDMITIQVENTLFRIPLNLLVDGSTHFTELREGLGWGSVLHITDDDVSVSSFESFLTALRPRRATSTITKLEQWTDVLRLSCKWSFNELREVAIQAIFPLASPADRLVLGRTYDIPKWIPDALAALTEREADLSVEEARNMTTEDVVAIANGRSRTSHPRKVIPEPVSPTGSSTQSDDSARLISRWLTQLRNKTSHDAAKSCLIGLMREDAKNTHLVLRDALRLGWRTFDSCVTNPNHQGSRMSNWDNVLADLEAEAKLGLYHTSETRHAALHLVDNWNALLRVDLAVPSKDILRSKPIATLINQTKYLAYCVDWTRAPRLFDASVFSAFWVQMKTLFLNTPCGRRINVLDVFEMLLNDLQYCTCRIVVSREMDAFYMTLEESREEERKRGQGKTFLAKLDKFINNRKWRDCTWHW